jgi:hypothetical protein
MRDHLVPAIKRATGTIRSHRFESFRSQLVDARLDL